MCANVPSVALLDVIMGYDCNLGCDYCTITPEMRRRALSSGAIVAQLDEGRRRGYDAVSFTGGEPTIRPDLLGLIRAARDRGYRDIKVQSNGLMFASAANVDRIIDAGANRFHVSIHTHEAAAYDRLVRRDQSHPLMVGGLDNLIAKQVRLTVDVILKSDTYPRLLDALAWLVARGVRTVHLWFVSLTDGNADNLESMPRMTEVMPIVHQAFAWARAHDLALRSLHIPRCLLGDDAGHALDPGSDHGGQVRVVTPDATFELRESKLSGQRQVSACKRCVHQAICPGLRDDYLRRYGDSEIVAVVQ